MKNADLFHEDNRATYCPEDNKLRLYVGRVPREEYEALRAEGWTSTPKQDCDFVAKWSPTREDTALSYADIVEDEDMTPEERAADRAERFSGYLDKRLAEAQGHAATYDAGPQAHGYQDKGRAVRVADRHDRHATRAVNAWDKAEYWQHRTAGVIAHALHRSSATVRRGRILEIEKEQRQTLKSLEDYKQKFELARLIQSDPVKGLRILTRGEVADGSACWQSFDSLGFFLFGYDKITHPRNPELKGSCYSRYKEITTGEDPMTIQDFLDLFFKTYRDPFSESYKDSRTSRWLRHYENRLAYEHQMIEAAGGLASAVEMEPGGWINGDQILKVNKSPATGRVVSVQIETYRQKYQAGEYVRVKCLANRNIEKLGENAYRPPTDEEREAFHAARKAEKAARPKAETIPLINPTEEDASKLQEVLNRDPWAKRNGATGEPLRLTQAEYSEHSKGAYGRCVTVEFYALGNQAPSVFMTDEKLKQHQARLGPVLCKVRIYRDCPRRVIILTDKPQKPLPAAMWQAVTPPAETPAPAVSPENSPA